MAAIGDAWSWLILREAVFDDVDRFEAFHDRLGIARSTLTARLDHLTANQLLQRTEGRYRPTGRGRDFFGCLMTAMAWGDRWCTAGGGVPHRAIHAGCGAVMTAELHCSVCRRPLRAREVRYGRRPGPDGTGPLFGARHRTPGLELLERRGASSIARTLQVMGDRWSGLVIRECFYGVRRFDDFQRRLGIATNILAERLDRLTGHGFLARVPYQRQPLRHEYRLTDKGLDFYPVPLAMLTWGDRWLANRRRPPVPLTHLQCGRRFTARLSCGTCGDPLTRADVLLSPLGGRGVLRATDPAAAGPP